MDYLLATLAGFFAAVFIQAWLRRERQRRQAVRQGDGDSRQAEAFLRGIKAFERGVATQIERDRRAARLRRLMAQRNRVL